MLDFDNLLRQLHRREASELRLLPDRSPQLILGNTASRLDLPEAPAGWLSELARQLMDVDRAEAFSQGYSVSFAFDWPDLGGFDMTVNGTPDAPQVSVRPQIDRTTFTIDPSMAVVGPDPGTQAPSALVEALAKAVKLGASDVHLGDNEPPMARLAGNLVPLKGLRISAMPIRPLVEVMLTTTGRRRLTDGGAVDFSFSVEGIGRFRGNAYRALKGYNLAIRSLPETIPTLEDLRLPRSLTELVEFREGLVLFTGPTGSGKSATMASLLQHVNRSRPCHVITLEDPIEFVHPRHTAVVRQREVGTHVESFATGLRDALREDPDVILVGEMRDLETISLAITAAETGHLVLSTLHANRAHSAMDRMVDVFPEHSKAQVRLQLSESLRAIVAQRLLPQADGKGRIAALEVLRNNNAIANNIREQRANQIPSVMQTHREQGMWVFERHLAALAKKGLITDEVARAYAGDQSLFQTYMQS